MRWSGRRNCPRLGSAGSWSTAPEFDALAAGGGREVNMPFWKDLTAARQLLSDSAPLTVNKITSSQDLARIHNDAQVWGVNHLAKVISGDDPMQEIVDLVGGLLGADGPGADGVVPEGDVRGGDHERRTCWRSTRRAWRGSRRRRG